MNQLDLACLPVDISQMIGQHHTRGSVRVGDLHFKGVALRLSRGGAEDAQARLAIVTSRTDHHRWATTSLFMSGNGIQRYPDQVATIGLIVCRFSFHPITS